MHPPLLSLTASSETNVWRADVDEDALMQQKEAEEERAASDQEEWAKSPRSSQKSSVKKGSSKQSMRSVESKGKCRKRKSPCINLENPMVYITYNSFPPIDCCVRINGKPDGLFSGDIQS